MDDKSEALAHEKYLILPKPSWELTLPPVTVEEWLESCGYDEWPLPVDKSEFCDIKKEFADLYCSEEEMLAKYIQGIEINAEPYDVVEKQIEALEKKVTKYSELLLEDSGLQWKKTDAISFIPTSFRFGGISNTEIIENVRSRKPNELPEITQTGGRAKIVQYALFPGFDEWELTPLPRQIEAPHILNKVTQGLTIDDSNIKGWKKYFFSQGCVALLQDMFWWILMDQFCPNAQEQDRLYNRISDSYVSLFLSLQEKHKDFFFSRFPEALAQAIYSAFCNVYTNSIKDFDDDFKTYLCNLTSEWICGSKPKPLCWKQWPYHLLQPTKMSIDHEPPKTGFKLSSQESQTEEQPITPHLFDEPKIVSDSHPIGAGPKFERVQFNIFGRSPLVSHYLDARHLGKDVPGARLVARTQVDSVGSEKPTYQEILKQSKKIYKQLELEHNRAVSLCEQDRRRVTKRYQREIDELKEIKKELMKHKNEVKGLSEKIVEYQNSDMYEPGINSEFVLEPYINYYREVLKEKKKKEEDRVEPIIVIENV